MLKNCVVSSNESKQKIAILLRCFKRGLKISNTDLADKIHVSFTCFSHYELGKINVNESVLKDYAKTIAKEMGFESEKFYRLLERGACKIQFPIDNTHVLKIAAKITSMMKEDI